MGGVVTPLAKLVRPVSDTWYTTTSTTARAFAVSAHWRRSFGTPVKVSARYMPAIPTHRLRSGPVCHRKPPCATPLKSDGQTSEGEPDGGQASRHDPLRMVSGARCRQNDVVGERLVAEPIETDGVGWCGEPHENPCDEEDSSGYCHDGHRVPHGRLHEPTSFRNGEPIFRSDAIPLTPHRCRCCWWSDNGPVP